MKMGTLESGEDIFKFCFLLMVTFIVKYLIHFVLSPYLLFMITIEHYWLSCKIQLLFNLRIFHLSNTSLFIWLQGEIIELLKRIGILKYNHRECCLQAYARSQQHPKLSQILKCFFLLLYVTHVLRFGFLCKWKATQFYVKAMDVNEKSECSHWNGCAALQVHQLRQKQMIIQLMKTSLQSNCGWSSLPNSLATTAQWLEIKSILLTWAFDKFLLKNANFLSCM